MQSARCRRRINLGEEAELAKDKRRISVEEESPYSASLYIMAEWFLLGLEQGEGRSGTHLYHHDCVPQEFTLGGVGQKALNIRHLPQLPLLLTLSGSPCLCNHHVLSQLALL
jgi:hypothetical protein